MAYWLLQISRVRLSVLAQCLIWMKNPNRCSHTWTTVWLGSMILPPNLKSFLFLPGQNTKHWWDGLRVIPTGCFKQFKGECRQHKLVDHSRANGVNNCDPQCSNLHPYCSDLLAAALWHWEPVSALCQDPGKIWLQFSFVFVSVKTEAVSSNDGIHHSPRCHNTRWGDFKSFGIWISDACAEEKDARKESISLFCIKFCINSSFVKYTFIEVHKNW